MEALMQETNKISYVFLSSPPSLKTPLSQPFADEIQMDKERSRRRSMSSKGRKRAALYEKLQLLRDVTNSTALNRTSIVVDASKYIEELKQKVEKLNQEIGTSEISSVDVQNRLPMVTVETLEKGGFLISVYSEKSSSGLLVSILEAFEELGLDVLDARVSCSDTFQLEAVGGESIQGQGEGIDAQMVKQAVLEAIKNWSENESNDIDE